MYTERRLTMTIENVTVLLVKRVMNWDIGPDRIMKGGREWMPRARFRPAEQVEDAFRLLEKAVPQAYAVGREADAFWARVRVSGFTGEAREKSMPLAICWALARALQIDSRSAV